MNVVRFNEPFEEVIKSLIKEADANWERPENKEWRTAPLFLYETTLDREDETIKAAIPEVNLRMPFPLCRVALTVTDEKRGRYKADYVVHAYDGGDTLEMIVKVKQLLDEGDIRLPDMVFTVSSLQWNNRDSRGIGKTFYGSTFRYDGKWIKGRDAILTEEGRLQLVNGAIDSLAGFALDSMSPIYHTAMVKPDQPGRSVEWTQQRTHYVFIAHGHPANRPGLEHGAAVTVDRNGELKRMAHARRAHYKTLRHPRYRFARGKSVYVRATWVGPKEWREKGSKQIYRILEPVADTLI